MSSQPGAPPSAKNLFLPASSRGHANGSPRPNVFCIEPESSREGLGNRTLICGILSRFRPDTTGVFDNTRRFQRIFMAKYGISPTGEDVSNILSLPYPIGTCGLQRDLTNPHVYTLSFDSRQQLMDIQICSVTNAITMPRLVIFNAKFGYSPANLLSQ